MAQRERPSEATHAFVARTLANHRQLVPSSKASPDDLVRLAQMGYQAKLSSGATARTACTAETGFAGAGQCFSPLAPVSLRQNKGNRDLLRAPARQMDPALVALAETPGEKEQRKARERTERASQAARRAEEAAKRAADRKAEVKKPKKKAAPEAPSRPETEPQPESKPKKKAAPKKEKQAAPKKQKAAPKPKKEKATADKDARAAKLLSDALGL